MSREPSKHMADPPPIGHNSRHFDIQRTVEELRGKVIRAHGGAKAPFKWKVIVRAWASDMTDRDFRQLTGHVIVADVDGKNASYDHESIALLTGTSARASQRSDAVLKKAGWIDSQRRKWDSVVRTVRIPEVISAALEKQSLANKEPPPMPVIPQDVDPPPMAVLEINNRHPWQFKNQEPPNLAPRTATHGGYIYTNNITNSPRTREREQEPPNLAGQENIPTTRDRYPANPPHWEHNAAIDPDERKAQRDVAWANDDTVMLLNGFEVELSKTFPSVNLAAALAVVTGDQLPSKNKSTAKQIKTAIFRRCGFMQQDETGKDRRYASARQGAKNRAGTKDWRDEQNELSTLSKSVLKQLREGK